MLFDRRHPRFMYAWGRGKGKNSPTFLLGFRSKNCVYYWFRADKSYRTRTLMLIRSILALKEVLSTYLRQNVLSENWEQSVEMVQTKSEKHIFSHFRSCVQDFCLVAVRRKKTFIDDAGNLFDTFSRTCPISTEKILFLSHHEGVNCDLIRGHQSETFIYCVNILMHQHRQLRHLRRTAFSSPLKEKEKKDSLITGHYYY